MTGPAWILPIDAEGQAMTTPTKQARCPREGRPLYQERGGLRCLRCRHLYSPDDPDITWGEAVIRPASSYRAGAPAPRSPTDDDVINGPGIELRLGEDLHPAAKTAADRSGRTLIQLIRDAVDHYLTCGADDPVDERSLRYARYVGGPVMCGLLLGEHRLAAVDRAAVRSGRKRAPWLRDAVEHYLDPDLEHGP